AEYARFVKHVPHLERVLIEDGIHLIKLWFSLGKKEQKKRFGDRRKDPLKHWKLSPVDQVALEKYDDYTKAIADMVVFTDTEASPWMIVNGNEKRRARLAAIAHVLQQVPYKPKAKKIAVPDPAVIAPAADLFDKDDLLLRR
ncbi:MAG: polyphosphate kinase 2, partial [Pseudomonadota bacterium]